MNKNEVQSLMEEYEGEDSSVALDVVENGNNYELILQVMKLEESSGYLYVSKDYVIDRVEAKKDLSEVKEEWIEAVSKIEKNTE